MLGRDEHVQKGKINNNKITLKILPISYICCTFTKYKITILLQNSTMEQDTHICEELTREVKILHN